MCTLYIFGRLHLTRICSTSELNLFKPAKIYQKHISFQNSSRHARWRREETLYKGQRKRFDCMSWINKEHTAETALASNIWGLGTGDGTVACIAAPQAENRRNVHGDGAEMKWEWHIYGTAFTICTMHIAHSTCQANGKTQSHMTTQTRTAHTTLPHALAPHTAHVQTYIVLVQRKGVCAEQHSAVFAYESHQVNVDVTPSQIRYTNE